MTKKQTKEQNKMTTYRATMIAEGVEEPKNEEEYIQAWQCLVSTGAVWKLQGWFQRTAMALIAEGIIHHPISKNDD